MNEVKTGKLQILAASCTCNFISKLLKEDKNLMILAQLYKKFTDCFVLEVLSQGLFQALMFATVFA